MKRRRKKRTSKPARQAEIRQTKPAPASPVSHPIPVGKIVGVLALACATAFIFNVSSDPSAPSDPSDLRPRRTPRPEPAFWASAQVPDPGREISPTVIRPQDLGVASPTPPINAPARIIRAITEDDLPALQSAALSWFEQDPTAARDWLAMQSTYEELQPAISYIAASISEKGDINTAVEWTALLTEGTLRDNTLFDIHALALRNGWITPEEISLDLIPPDRREELLSGAGGD